ncbi:MAG: hypothetical protein JWO78_1024 [Micavibrio sp.]|nr:hypothetical protein [Micavibrio sp.]
MTDINNPEPEIQRDKAKFFRWPNYVQEAAHIGAAAALMAGVGFWVGPLTLLGCAAGAGLLVVGGNVWFEKVMPSIFTRREVNDTGRTKLQAMVEYFTSKAGLKHTPTLYDMKIDKQELAKQEENHTTPAQVQRIFNAAAAGFRRPNVLISEDLLEAMEPKETESIIGHEFAHLGAEHIKLQMAANWLQTTTMFSAMFGFGAAVISEGWLVGVASIAASAGISVAAHKMMPKKEDRYARDGTPRPGVRRTQLGILAGQETLSIGVLAYANPKVVLAAFAIEHGFFWSSNLINKSLSRRHEFQADAGAVAMGSDPLALITSLRKMERALELNEPAIARSLNWRQGPLYERGLKMIESLFRTHPDTQRRCNRLAKIAAQQGRSADEIKVALTGLIDDKALAPATYEEMDAKEKAWNAASGKTAKEESRSAKQIRAKIEKVLKDQGQEVDMEIKEDRNGNIEALVNGSKSVSANKLKVLRSEALGAHEHMSDIELNKEFQRQAESGGFIDPELAKEVRRRLDSDYKPTGPA